VVYYMTGVAGAWFIPTQIQCCLSECPCTVCEDIWAVHVCVCMCTGMPFNQLGTLAGSGCYGLNAAYYYIRWSTCFSCVWI